MVRAADALPLAAALEWCEGIPQGRVFLAADQKLSGDGRSQRIRRETGLESSPYVRFFIALTITGRPSMVSSRWRSAAMVWAVGLPGV